MRKLISHLHVTLDGFMAGPDGDLDWVDDGHDNEIWDEVNALIDTVDTVLFGRTTYGGFAEYWPTAPSNLASTENEVNFAHWITKTAKVVASTTLESAEWENTRLIRYNVPEEVTVMKAQPGRDLLIFGSNGLVSSLLKWGLIDEFHISVHPVVLGRGLRFYEGLNHRQQLKLTYNKTLHSGVVSLQYRVAGRDSK